MILSTTIENKWHYGYSRIHALEDLPDHQSLFGFCYKITNLKTGNFYIGKKQFWNSRRKKLTLKEKKTSRKKYKVVIKESDWKDYWGSNENLQKDVASLGPSFFKREILALANTPKCLSYLEAKYQFFYDVLTVPSYNKNILGRFFTHDLECLQ
jgi:hypothetical protein